jgi:hypothetical protein
MNRITNEQREAIVREAVAKRDALLEGAPLPYRCIKPQCPVDCSMCNHAVPGDDEARILIADLLNAFAVDGFDAPCEDGDSVLVDRARRFLRSRTQQPALIMGEAIENAHPLRCEARAAASASSQSNEQDSPASASAVPQPRQEALSEQAKQIAERIAGLPGRFPDTISTHPDNKQWWRSGFAAARQQAMEIATGGHKDGGTSNDR